MLMVVCHLIWNWLNTKSGSEIPSRYETRPKKLDLVNVVLLRNQFQLWFAAASPNVSCVKSSHNTLL